MYRLAGDRDTNVREETGTHPLVAYNMGFEVLMASSGVPATAPLGTPNGGSGGLSISRVNELVTLKKHNPASGGTSFGEMAGYPDSEEAVLTLFPWRHE